jgi:O-antigen/teichoic acid export membrane protein
MMNNIRQRTLSGLGWSGTSQVLGAVLQFGISVILARLLSPRDFGLIGMVLVFTGFASTLSEMGLGASLVQKRALSDRHLNTVFWANVAAGTLLAILFLLTAPLIALFYQEPVLRLLTAVLSLNLILGSLNVVQNALLVRSLNFRSKFWIGSVGIAISGIVGIAMAFSGAGVWSIVGQSITSTVIQVAVMWRLAPWRPKFSFDLSAFKELIHFGGNLMGASIFHYWGRNIDKLLVGRLLGSSALGIYTIADKLMRLPVSNITDITSAVMFPALSAMQDEVESIKRTYLRATRMIALLTFPMMIVLIILAEPAILAVYGEKWHEAVGIVQVLCFSGMAQSIYFTGGWIFLSQGRTDIVLRWSIYTTLVRVVGVFVGAQWGLIGVAWAYVLGTYVFICYPAWSCAGRLVGLGFKPLIKNVAGPFYCAVSMGLILWISDRWILGSQVNVVRLAIQVPLGILVYGFLIRQFRLEVFGDVQKIIIEIGGERNRFLRWLIGDRSQVAN